MKEHYILGKYTRVLVRSEDAIFGAGSKQYIFKEKKGWENLVLVASKWINSKTTDEAYNSVSNFMCRDDFERVFDFLLTHHFLAPAETAKNIFHNRYSRNHLHYQSCGMDPEKVQRTLSGKKVLILGCGGIGNHVSAVLATSGVGELILVDDDIVEITNLTRQILFTEQDIGLAKTSVLNRELSLRNSDVKISEIKMCIKGKSDIDKLPKVDLWIISADEPYYLVPWLNEWCVEHRQPYINSGYVNDIAVFGPFYIPGKTGCYACNSSVGDLPESDNPSVQEACAAINSNFKVATFPPVNALSAAMCANDALKFLGDFGEPLSLNRRVGIWSSELFSEERLLEKNPCCKICGKEK
ncbi:molybdopterin/thiamine biosynthesis adenylyltransferase|uniref:Molybdopterin/thiamine biosynthesis adenylyltransferase n=3 Tax=Enterobacterales TaxID=91347 RepID=A0A366I7C6_9GAMM|nr:molybdopterin/thiamine biosynthesis adenylyltransferase [Brenneria salicis ATCC 15712 = DSM 30166]RBP64054.1 molybdopterin/thiamine biosynthesis adenylyltransferase [Brenneria salicis ATCC 15712 = DSM 30166]RLM31152.1 methylcrotonoyl-CoA carboxylase [Brenneria salicis ATCC 15712 = DSM 30166]